MTDNLNHPNSEKLALGYKSLRTNCLGSIKIKLNRFSSSGFFPKLVRFVNQKLYTFGMGAALNRYDAGLVFYSAKNDRKLYQSYNADDKFYNFGSGAFYHPRWVNYDFPGNTDFYKSIQGEPGKDFQPIDLCVDNLTLSIADDSASLIYCAHTLEHLEEAKAIVFLKECLRILKPGGIMRVAVPDAAKNFQFVKIICEQDSISEATKHHVILSAAQHVLFKSRDLADETVIDYVIQSGFSAEKFHKICAHNGVPTTFDTSAPDNHITFWDQAKLFRTASEVGFSKYFPLYRGQSLAGPFRNIEVFDSTEPQISLYGEFVKG